MRHAIYDTLTPWYFLLDPTADHDEEVAGFLAAYARAIEGPRETLLELGAGAGNNAFFAKRAYRCTLTDLSPSMQALSRALNPECEHVLGDMRTLRLGCTFDAVLVHDAVVYMRSEGELRQAIETAFVHTRPGGAAIFAPDCLREDFHDYAQLHEGEGEGRSLRCLEWSWDPDPTDTQYTVEYALLLRADGRVEAVHDTHVEGLFDRATWLRLLRDVGFAVEEVGRDLDADAQAHGYAERVFLCRRASG